MTFSAGDKIHGFTVESVRFSDELNGTLIEMKHSKTNTSLIWMDNGEINKLFSIAFKTTPENDTGVFHILEHSVLNGSEKYPVREPFVELLKSSMNTFLNAMTFPDKTMYPVSSRNEQDFLNLTSVYLDAVFAPRILIDPNIFYQEGWHIEEDNGEYVYKGVVFNEMKGAMSDVGRLSEQKLLSMLFPDTCYGFNSGGDPEYIPSLTYEMFTDSYRRFYHPSNARIYLDGSVPIEKTLLMIDEYLSKYQAADNLPEIQIQKKVSSSDTQYYEIASNEPLENKSCLTIGKIVGDWTKPYKNLAAYVVSDVLAGSNTSPIKRAVLEAGLTQDMAFSIEDSVAQPYMMIHFTNIQDGSKDQILALIREKTEEIIAKGFDKAEVLASVNRLAFRLREPNEPTGIYRAINALSGWQHGGDALTYMTTNDSIEKLIEMADTGEYEEIAREMLLDEEGLCVLLSLPSHTRGDEKRAEEKERIKAITARWSDEEKTENREMNEKLVLWQNTPDSKEQLDTLPVLSISEVSEEPEFNSVQKTETDGAIVLANDIAVKGVTHASLYFNLSDLSIDEISYAKMLASMLGKLSTKKHDAANLQSLIKTYIGRVEFGVEAYAEEGNTKECTPYLTARMSALNENFEKAAELFCEIITETRLDEIPRIREISIQNDENIKQMGVYAGHSIAITSALSCFSADNAVKDAAEGYTYAKNLHAFVKDFDAKIDALAGLSEKILSEYAVKNNLTVSITGEKDACEILRYFAPGKKAQAKNTYKSMLPDNMGVRIPAQIGFAVKANHLSAIGQKFHAGLRVAENILSLSHLWNMIRVQGGAYGAGFVISRFGNMFAYSYRDPSPARSLGIYGEMAEFLRAFAESGEDIDKFIISTIASTEPLSSPREKARKADSYYFTGITYEDVKKTRREMLETNRDTLIMAANAIEAYASSCRICVAASDPALKTCGELEVFDM
ncbi:MAG: insulinase family protein [Clostridia bacterium]|nr:insulinase family protein [Clostridia bacterium]